jgi:hypothetical protein
MWDVTIVDRGKAREEERFCRKKQKREERTAAVLGGKTEEVRRERVCFAARETESNRERMRA